MNHRIRTILAGSLAALGVLAVVSSMLLGYGSRTFLNSEMFADRVAASLSDTRVSALITDRATEGIIVFHRDLFPYKPIIQSSIQSMVMSAPFRGIVRRGVRTSHSMVMSGRGERILLNLTDLGVILRTMLATHPQLVQKIPQRLQTFVTDSKTIDSSKIVEMMRSFQTLRLRPLFVLALGLLFIGAALLFSSHKVNMLFRINWALVIVSLMILLFVLLGGALLEHWIKDPLLGQAAAGLWDAFFQGFRSWILILCAICLILIAAITSFLDPAKISNISRNVLQWFASPPVNKRDRAIRGIIFLAIGILVFLNPSATITLIVVALGLILSYLGVHEIFEVILGTKSIANQPGKPARVRKGRLMWTGATALLLIVTVTLILIHLDSTAEKPLSITTCNGSTKLCDRPLNEVVFPASHNSMSAGDVQNWMFPNQEKGITSQLNDGIRGLLFDVHYGVPVEDKIKTSIENEPVARAKYEKVIGKEGVDAAMRIRDRLIAGDERETDIYLCHGFCELGASPLKSALEQIRDFLITNPEEVLIFVIQDEGVTPQDLEKCFVDTGLIEYVYRKPAGPSWPTLKEMIASDQRVLVLTENESIGVAWIHPAFQTLQETPYSFKKSQDFSCIPNRGDTSGSLFLMNHWIETAPSPKPSNASIVNAYDFLLSRARQCQKERGHLPNLIAVDFYQTGDLIKVAEVLNNSHE